MLLPAETAGTMVRNAHRQCRRTFPTSLSAESTDGVRCGYYGIRDRTAERPSFTLGIRRAARRAIPLKSPGGAAPTVLAVTITTPATAGWTIELVTITAQVPQAMVTTTVKAPTATVIALEPRMRFQSVTTPCSLTSESGNVTTMPRF